MKTNKLILCFAVVLILTFSVIAASAKSDLSYWDGYYCYSGNCGVNANFNPGSLCAVNYLAPYRADFVRDVNYPDGTYVIPGSSFTKTWRLRNTGTQAWTTDMQLVYVAGDPMNAYNVYMPHYVAPGNTVDISVKLTVPTYGGTVSGQWMLQAPDGTLFGVGCNGQVPVWVSVNTWTSGACSCLGQPTCNCKGPSARSGRNPYCNNKIREVKDVTYPDGSVVAPGATFRKTWSMKNGGTCVWDENYVLSFFYGDDFGFDGQVSITPGYAQPNYNGQKYQPNRQKNAYIYPGDYVYVSVDLKAPTTPGTYEAYFKLRDNLGYEFGFGSYADAAFWVNVRVADDGKKTTVVDGAEPIPVDGNQKKSQDIQVVEAVVEEVPAANKCGEQSIALRPTDTGYQVLWTAVNNGTAAWDGYSLINSDSNPAIKLVNSNIAVPTTAPGETAEVTFDVEIDNSKVSSEALWMEFSLTSGTENFCEFYFEAPAK